MKPSIQHFWCERTVTARKGNVINQRKGQLSCIINYKDMIHKPILYYRDPQSEDNRAVRRRLCRKENLIEYYDRFAKKWIFLDKDDPRVAVPGKKLTVGSNSAAPDVDSKSRCSNGGGDSSSSSFNSTSIPSAAPHYHLRSSPVAATQQSQPKKLPPSSQRPSKGKAPSSNEEGRVADADDHISHQLRAEESDAESAESNSATKSNGARKQRWTTKADEKLQAIVLKHGTQSWKQVRNLLNIFISIYDAFILYFSLHE